MSHDDTLLQQVIESPDDNAPRLAYADWLDRHDDPPRAEFIRVQCSLAGMADDDPRRPVLEHRERELLDQYGWAWAEGLGPLVSAWAYRRGFIEHVEMGLETSREEIVAVLQKAPIRYVRDISQFCELDGVVEALPDLRRLRGLEFWWLYAFDDALLAKVLASRHLANLQTLILHHDRNGNLANEDVLVEAMHSPHRANLEELAVNVDGMWRGPSRKILRAIAASPHLRKLRKLNLSNAGDEGNRPEMDRETVEALGTSANLAGLEELDMGQTSFPLEAWDEVLRWPWLPRLKWLRLHYARQVNPPSVLTVAKIEDLPEYRRAFEEKVATVDWVTEWLTPWDGTASWQGLSWHGLRQRHLFSIWPYGERGDFDGLEAAFRADCRKYAGDAAVGAIDALVFERYQAELAPGLEQGIAASGRRGARSIYLRIRPDIEWNGEYHLSSEDEHEPFEPHEAYSYGGVLKTFKAPSFPEAEAVWDRFSERKALDPGGVLHYLLARTVAAFGRCVAQTTSPVPIYFSCMYAVFRMSPGAAR